MNFRFPFVNFGIKFHDIKLLGIAVDYFQDLKWHYKNKNTLYFINSIKSQKSRRSD
jgi:hypothetical protein